MRGTRLYVNTPTGIAAYHSCQLLVGRKAAKATPLADWPHYCKDSRSMVGRKKRKLQLQMR
jgi:hypothetical protein